MDLYTIGHSNHPIDKFIQLLVNQKIQCVVDIRTTPFSRFHPQFNQARLQQSLAQKGIEYFDLGAALGGRPADPSCYKHKSIPTKPQNYLYEVDYAEVMRRLWFIQGIQQVLEIAGERTTAILCSEADPNRCHRHHLVARYLIDEHPEVTVWHILKDGSLIDAQTIPALEDKQAGDQLSF